MWPANVPLYTELLLIFITFLWLVYWKSNKFRLIEATCIETVKTETRSASEQILCTKNQKRNNFYTIVAHNNSTTKYIYLLLKYFHYWIEKKNIKKILISKLETIIFNEFFKMGKIIEKSTKKCKKFYKQFLCGWFFDKFFPHLKIYKNKITFTEIDNVWMGGFKKRLGCKISWRKNRFSFTISSKYYAFLNQLHTSKYFTKLYSIAHK